MKKCINKDIPIILITQLPPFNMTVAFESMVNSNLISKLFYSNTNKNFVEIKEKISLTLIRKDDSDRCWSDEKLFLREDPNSCHYFPFKFDLTSDHIVCRQEYDELCLQIQEFQSFKTHTEFLVCLKDNFHDYMITRLHQLFHEYYSIVTNCDSEMAKTYLNDLLDVHDYLNADMEKINILLGEKNQPTYKFYTLYPTMQENCHHIFCFHIKSFINFPEKIFMCKDNEYLHFNEITPPMYHYKTRQSMVLKCPKCGEQYHQEKNKHSNVGGYHEKFFYSKSLQ